MAYTPHVVVSGFMSGIGVIVMLIQILPFLGAPTAMGGPLGTLRALPAAVADANINAFAIALATLLVGVLWPRKWTRFMPGPLVALIVGTLLGVLALRDVPVIGPIPTGLPQLHLALPSVGFLVSAIQPALILALLGSVDQPAYLAGGGLDDRHPSQRRPRADRPGPRQYCCRAVRRRSRCGGPPWER